jgi:hypothetical protein
MLTPHAMSDALTRHTKDVCAEDAKERDAAMRDTRRLAKMPPRDARLSRDAMGQDAPRRDAAIRR